jgi:hypothetical protein
MAMHFLALLLSARLSDTVSEEAFTLQQPAEVMATITAGCSGCSWGAKGREAAILVLEVDGRYSQHLALLRGEKEADYAVLLGPLAAGSHRLQARRDDRWSAKGAGDVRVESISFRPSAAGDADYEALARAPFVYARPGTLKRFSDLPLLTWYESEPTERGRRLRYSVVFTNEDGGTPVDRLMATWGRTTDVEFVYSVELDADGRVLAETHQTKDHKLLPFAGRREGAHPLLWVVTENNMLGDRGKTKERFAPAPRPADLTDRSREAVMDAHPWTYRVTSEEARREGRVAEDALPGSRMIPDPRRFVFLEACAPGVDVTLSFAVGVAGKDGGLAWHASDGGGKKFRVSREAHNFPNGCFQSAAALPGGVEASAVRAIRLQAHTRLPGKDEAPLPPGTGRARFLRVNRLFMLDANDEPGANLLTWTGDVPLVGEGAPCELPVGPEQQAGAVSSAWPPPPAARAPAERARASGSCRRAISGSGR